MAHRIKNPLKGDQLSLLAEIPNPLARKRFVELFNEALTQDLDATGPATFEGPAQTPVNRLSRSHRQWIAHDSRVALGLVLALLLAAPAFAEDDHGEWPEGRKPGAPVEVVS